MTRPLKHFALTLTLVLAGCGQTVGRSGDVVGGPCTSGSGCASGSVCETASMYPGGMCAVACDSQADCPSGSVCITEGGGRCVLPCSSASDCRDGYGCNEKSTPGDGHANVCIR
ncbi:MAG: hypothetical protein J0L92_23350 [Deltaproteobacteria bacterium]|nr:hypothetical protein [Deltaproteobacteria bacterium]